MVRTSDTACRYGGDEFVVVLTTADESAARIFADRPRTTCRPRRPPPSARRGRRRRSASARHLPADGTTLRDLLRKADGRLYESKRVAAAR
jgi:diguanylate cyclase (GGDEF)-like protein